MSSGETVAHVRRGIAREIAAYLDKEGAPPIWHRQRDQIARVVFDALEAQRGMPPVGPTSWLTLGREDRPIPAVQAAFAAADRIQELPAVPPCSKEHR